MDFMNRGERPVQQNTQTQTSGGAHSAKTPGNGPKGLKIKDKNKMLRAAFVAGVALVAVILLLILASLMLFKDAGSREAEKVDQKKFQAVFLNGGQVYFGKIDDLNGKSISMNNIYYLRVNQQVQPNQEQNTAANDISLVKLGCELHGPEDRMVINREQVIFWENLKDDGQVAKAVAKYIEANPDGQKCDQQQSTGTGGSTDANANTGTNSNTNTGANTGATPATGNNQNR